MAHQRIGTMQCWSCRETVPVKKTDTGKLSAACPWCDFPHYANAGTKHFANLLKATTLDAPGAAEETKAAPPPAPKPDPAPGAEHVPAPGHKVRRSPFGFGGR